MKVVTPVQQTNPSITTNYWIKIYTKAPYSIHFMGPFSTETEAKASQKHYVIQLEAKGERIVSCFKIFPLSRPVEANEPLSHTQWLQGLMEDYLHVKIPYATTRETTEIKS